jgi:hypothetical protein
MPIRQDVLRHRPVYRFPIMGEWYGQSQGNGAKRHIQRAGSQIQVWINGFEVVGEGDSPLELGVGGIVGQDEWLKGSPNGRQNHTHNR